MCAPMCMSVNSKAVQQVYLCCETLFVDCCTYTQQLNGFPFQFLSLSFLFCCCYWFVGWLVVRITTAAAATNPYRRYDFNGDELMILSNHNGNKIRMSS